MADRDSPETNEPKPVQWVGSSRRDLKRFPVGVRQVVGQALFDAQMGEKHPDAKVLHFQ